MTPAEEIAALRAENTALNEQVKALEAQLHELQARLAKDSHNSSKLYGFRSS
jgi:phage shock protein A